MAIILPSESVANFWTEYPGQHRHPEEAKKRYFETFQISSKANGAKLIKAGTKTTTSSLLWSIEAVGEWPPSKGDLSIPVL